MARSGSALEWHSFPHFCSASAGLNRIVAVPVLPHCQHCLPSSLVSVVSASVLLSPLDEKIFAYLVLRLTTFFSWDSTFCSLIPRTYRSNFFLLLLLLSFYCRISSRCSLISIPMPDPPSHVAPSQLPLPAQRCCFHFTPVG